jgi:hypothetical protein
MWTLRQLRARWREIVGYQLSLLTWPRYIDESGVLEIATAMILSEDDVHELMASIGPGLPEAVEGRHLTGVCASWYPELLDQLASGELNEPGDDTR